MRDVARPPKDIAPARLFRLLLQRPRPVLPLSLRLNIAPEAALSVRALTALEDEATRDIDDSIPAEVRRSTWVMRTIAAALLADGEAAFSSAAQVGQFSEPEIIAMGGAVLDALAIIGPTYRYSDAPQWANVLARGAAHNSNVSITSGIGQAALDRWQRGSWLRYDYSGFFGLPLIELTDGQRMAYDAARKVFEGYIK